MGYYGKVNESKNSEGLATPTYALYCIHLVAALIQLKRSKLLNILITVHLLTKTADYG